MMSRQEELRERKRRAVELMDVGVSWQEANERSGLKYSRRGIQQLYQRWQEHGNEALIDNRHGHSYKATAEVQDWLGERCTEDSEVRSSQLVSEIEARFGVELHPGYVTLLRHQLGLPVPRPGRRRIREEATPVLESEPEQGFSPG
jgi:transposase